MCASYFLFLGTWSVKKKFQSNTHIRSILKMTFSMSSEMRFSFFFLKKKKMGRFKTIRLDSVVKSDFLPLWFWDHIMIDRRIYDLLMSNGNSAQARVHPHLLKTIVLKIFRKSLIATAPALICEFWFQIQRQKWNNNSEFGFCSSSALNSIKT